MTSAPFRRAAPAVALLALAATGLAACETDYGPNRYADYETGVPARVDEGRVISFRPVALGGDPGNAAAGTVGGAVAGGLIGSAVAPRHDGAALGIAGALLGAVAGNALARGSGDHPGFAYIVRRRDGSTLEIAQPDPAPIPIGTRVFVSYGARVRITPAAAYGGGYPPPPPPPPPPRY